MKTEKAGVDHDFSVILLFKRLEANQSLYLNSITHPSDHTVFLVFFNYQIDTGGFPYARGCIEHYYYV